MRYHDLKITESKIQLDELVQNPALARPENMDVNQALEYIDSQSENVDDDTKSKILQYLKKFKAHLLGQKVPTNEGVSEAIDKEVADIEKLLADAPKDLSQTELEYIQHIAKLCMQKGAQVGHTELNKIKAKIESLYAPLANKIVTGGRGFAPEVPMPEDDADTAAIEYAQEMQLKRSELSKTGQAVADTIADMTNAVMEKAGRQENIYDAEAELEKIYNFLERCVSKPFINFDTLISKTHGTVEQEFASSEGGSEFVDIYNQFENILGRTIDKSGAGAWGPGELGLLMLADPVRKGNKGDIETGSSKQVEVKASKKASSGARLNVEQATKGNLTREYNQVLKKYFGESVFVGDEEIKVDHQTPKGQVNFTIKGFDILNSWAEELIKQNKWKKADAVKFLIESVNIPMRNYVGESVYDSALKEGMTRVVTKEGLFSFQAFQKEYTKLLFAIYKSEMLDCILVINPILGTFLVMNDPADVDDSVTRGLTISGGIDFKDKQSTKSPQIGVGKISQ